jgi:hypothetical protein
MAETPCESYKQSPRWKFAQSYGHPREVKDCGRNASHEIRKGNTQTKGLLKGLKGGDRLMKSLR